MIINCIPTASRFTEIWKYPIVPSLCKYVVPKYNRLLKGREGMMYRLIIRSTRHVQWARYFYKSNDINTLVIRMEIGISMGKGQSSTRDAVGLDGSIRLTFKYTFILLSLPLYMNWTFAPFIKRNGQGVNGFQTVPRNQILVK